MSTDYVCQLDEEAQKYAEEFLKESRETRNTAIAEIRQWLEDNPEINGRTEDEYILTFLRCCKFDVERTKQKLLKYYLMRAEVSEWFCNRDPNLPEIQELIKLGVFMPLKRTFDQKMVVIVRTAAHDPKRFSLNDVIKTGMMILDIAAKENEYSQIYGVIALFDMNGISIGHAKQLSTQLIKRIVNAWQNYHCRPKQLEFINAPVYINMVLKIFKSFMSEKLKNRIRVHPSGTEGLHRVVDKDILPVEYGGNESSVQELGQYWAEKVITYNDWFKEDERYKTFAS